MVERGLQKYRWAWCVLSGLLLVFSFAPFSCAPCAWIALVPAWWLVSRVEEVRARPMRYGYFIGLICYGSTFWWISDVTILGIVFLIPYLALYPAVWLLLVTRFLKPWVERTNVSVILQAIGGAALWVILEWWRSWFLTGFDWNELGDTQATSIAFRQLAAYGGVHLLSFLLVLVNILWAEGALAMLETLRNRRTVRVSFIFGTAFLLVALGFALGCAHLFRHRGERPLGSVTFACIQPDIAQMAGGMEDAKMQQALDTQVSLSLKAMADHPQLLIWPEATIDEGVFNDRPMNEAVESVCDKYDGYFLLGSQDFDMRAHKIYNAAYLFSPHGERYDEYRKVYLVVMGEYFPIQNKWLRKKFDIGGMDFSRGTEPRKFVLDRLRLSFAPLICFEDTQADVVQRAARTQPDFFITISDDAWYTGWCGYWGITQHLQEAVFRTVEHDRPMVRGTNNGISCVIDQNGTVTSRYRDPGTHRQIDVQGIFRGTLQPYPAHRTLYELWGDWIVLLSSGISVILSIPFFRDWRRRPRSPARQP